MEVCEGGGRAGGGGGVGGGGWGVGGGGGGCSARLVVEGWRDVGVRCRSVYLLDVPLAPAIDSAATADPLMFDAGK